MSEAVGSKDLDFDEEAPLALEEEEPRGKVRRGERRGGRSWWSCEKKSEEEGGKRMRET